MGWQVNPALDPAAGIVLRAAVAALLLSAASHKLRDPLRFREALSEYELSPRRWSRVLATLLIAAELVLGAALLFSPLAGIAAAALFAIYAAAIGVNLARGRRDIDCGCAGPAGRMSLHGALVARNLVLVAVALAAALPCSDRKLVWLDCVTIGAALAVVVLLYSAVETAIANEERNRGWGLEAGGWGKDSETSPQPPVPNPHNFGATG